MKKEKATVTREEIVRRMANTVPSRSLTDDVEETIDRVYNRNDLVGLRKF
jgi:hypothetical protein